MSADEDSRGNPGTRDGGIPEKEDESSWTLDRLPWPEVGRVLARDPRLLLPVGALIQHGPHLPLGTNTFIARAVAREVSRRTGILVAPCFHYGVSLAGGERFAGSAGLRRKTLHRALNELLAGWEDHGVREFFFVTAHRHEPHLDALLMALTTSATTMVVNLHAIPVDDVLEGSPLLEHGGEMDTSLMLHLAPDRVRMDQASDVEPEEATEKRYGRGKVATPPAGSRGTLGYPSRASARKGHTLLLRYVETVLEILRASKGQRPAPGG